MCTFFYVSILCSFLGSLNWPYRFNLDSLLIHFKPLPKSLISFDLFLCQNENKVDKSDNLIIAWATFLCQKNRFWTLRPTDHWPIDLFSQKLTLWNPTSLPGLLLLVIIMFLAIRFISKSVVGMVWWKYALN